MELKEKREKRKKEKRFSPSPSFFCEKKKLDRRRTEKKSTSFFLNLYTVSLSRSLSLSTFTGKYSLMTSFLFIYNREKAERC